MDDQRLPVLNHPMTHAMAACALPGGLSEEEVALVAEIHRVRQRAAELQRRLEAATAADERSTLAAELEALREERARVVAQRETAWHDKMVRLGHLAPDQG